jgi:hypothetical protein
MLDAKQIIRLHDESTLRWHQDAPSPQEPAPSGPVGPIPVADAPPSATPELFLQLVEAHHHANFDLWHEEDKARDPLAAESDIAHVKHSIDGLNQRRNDLVETLDRMLLTAAGEQSPSAPLHSESPGLILDRLSILELKIYHTAEEAQRPSATESHRQKNRDRLALLTEQRDDLAGCLDVLWAEVHAGKRRFKLYRQLKMYNDPELNPAVYTRRTG